MTILTTNEGIICSLKKGGAMPSQTFFNLSKEKQDVILSAAKKEFARVPFEQASLVNIAKDAGISRSNLYNYFTDKQELLSYMFEHFKQSLLLVVKNSLEKSCGDIFALFQDMFYYMIHYGFSEENFCLFRSVLSNQRFSDQTQTFDFVKQHNQCIIDLLSNESFQCQSLSIQSKDDLQNVLDLFMCITMKAAVDTYNHPKEKEIYMKRYENKLNLLKYGLLKRRPNNGSINPKEHM